MTILNIAVDSNLLLQKPDGYLNMYFGFAKAWFFKYVRMYVPWILVHFTDCHYLRLSPSLKGIRSHQKYTISRQDKH